MQRTLLVRVVAVVALTLVVGEGRAMAQNLARKVSSVGSDASHPLSLSLASTNHAGLGLRDSSLIILQSDDSGNLHGYDDERGPEQDDVAARQSMDSFTSLEDGQPSAPGLMELQLDFGWSTISDESDSGLLDTQLKYTPDGSDFLRNMKLSVTVPLELGNARIDGNGDSEFAWQQRWVAEHDDTPTFATILSMRAPTGDRSSGFDGTFVGIVAKDWGPGTFFFNGWVKSANGNNIENRRDFQWGGRFAYLWHFAEDAALTIDYVNQTSEVHGESNINLLELGAQFEINDRLTVGPGVFVSLDGKDSTPNFGGGIRVTYGF